MPTEFPFLAAAAVADLEPTAADRLAAELGDQGRDPVRPVRLLRLARTEGLTGLLARNLIHFDLLDLLPAIRGDLENTYRRIARDNLLRTAALGELLSQLAAERIPTVLLKGMALLVDVYDDPGLRDMSDIDLWIQPSDLKALTDRLRSLGYTSLPLYPSTWQRNGVIVDLHTHPLGADRIRTRRFLLAREASEIFAAARPVTVAGAQTHLLEPADRVLLLSLHALKHNLGKAIWLVDIHRLTRPWAESQWATFFIRAESDGQGQAAARILSLLRAMLAVPFPPVVDRWLAGAVAGTGALALDRRLLNRRTRGNQLPAWTALLWYLPPAGRGRRMRFVAETLFPRSEILRQIFPARARWPAGFLYLLRVFQVAGWIAAAVPTLITAPFPGLSRSRSKTGS